MVFLVFLEVLEMSSEVVGPGPNTRYVGSLPDDEQFQMLVYRW